MARVLLYADGMNLPAIIMMVAALSGGTVRFEFSTKFLKAPPINEVQQNAIEYARLNPSEITSWKKRARYAPLLPRLQLDYNQQIKNTVNVDISDSAYVGSGGVTVGPRQGSYKEDQNADQNLGFKAVWNFSEAIFSPNTLAISEETRLLARERQMILAEVNRNYYERERLIGEISFLNNQLKKDLHPEKLRQEIFTKKVSIDESVAALDALTGGWFGRQLR